MIVIADTSPLHYLIPVQATGVLPRLFGRVMIPAEVHAELRHKGAPAEVRQWITDVPSWLEVLSVSSVSSAVIADLDVGEEAAIRLAEELGASAFLLMDDAKGRREATRRGIPSTGTLGVLQAASKSGLLTLRAVLPLLLQTNFYISPALAEALIAEEQSRARQQ